MSTEGRILPELAWKGFDAIQIPPAQVSPNGGNLVLLWNGASNGGSISLWLQLYATVASSFLWGDLRRDWYLRYQPVNYQHIDLRLGTNRNHYDADSGEFCLDLLFG